MQAAQTDRIRVLALAGNPEAQVVLGQMLLDGTAVPRDPARAFGWFLASARAGHPMGQNMLGRVLENGWGIASDITSACVWYRRAAEAGLDWGMYNYATQLVLGGGMPVDRKQAFAWFVRAVALGHAKSANILGGFYEDGWEVVPDREQARSLYGRASEGSDFRGHFNLARLLVEDGRIDEAVPLLVWARDGATDGFRNLMRHWVLILAIPALQAAIFEEVAA